MKTWAGRWPSAGFVAVWLTYGLVAVFFVWGFSTPPLDRVWSLAQGLKTGQIQRLKARDRATLSSSLVRYPALAGSLLDEREIGIISANNDGWIATPTATILRTPKSGGQRTLRLDVQTAVDLIPFEILVRGESFEKTVAVTGQGRLDIPLPEATTQPEIFEVRVRGKKFSADPSVLSLRLLFPEGPAKQPRSGAEQSPEGR